MTATKAKRVKKKILVVEDNRVTLRMLERTLSDAGYAVIPASDGREAVRMAKLRRPDLLILDIVLPGLDGIGVACSLRDDPTTEGIPIIFLSALLGKTKGQEIKPIEGTSFIGKPWKKDELLKEVAHYL
ncbi:MAG: response regulator [Acidobacteriota bacterium]